MNRNFFKKIVKKLLRFLAKAILKKYRPVIVGVTGSIGKTSTKEAIYVVLSHRFNARRNIKNYNNEIGLPLTIIGASSGHRSIWLWIGVFVKALVLLIWREKNYPQILVLEMAVDRIGDMTYLTDLAPCRIGVVTHVSAVHLEFFKTLEKIAKEKSVMISHLDKSGWAILNADNHHVHEMEKIAKSRVLTYGIKNQADLMASEINIFRGDRKSVVGLSFKLNYRGSIVPIFLPNILGEHLIYAALAAAAVGVAYGMNLVDISQSLLTFKAPQGRMRLIPGIKNTFIIDDTYNAGPDSTIAALKTLGQIKTAGRRLAVLGDMLELGDYNEEGHRLVGEAVVKEKIDYLLTVGERSRVIAAEVKRRGLDSDQVFIFSELERAGRLLQDLIKPGDYILIKGSQGIRMEKIVKEIMAEPLKAKEILVRQEKPWE